MYTTHLHEVFSTVPDDLAAPYYYFSCSSSTDLQVYRVFRFPSDKQIYSHPSTMSRCNLCGHPHLRVLRDHKHGARRMPTVRQYLVTWQCNGTWRRTCNQQAASPTPGRALPG